MDFRQVIKFKQSNCYRRNREEEQRVCSKIASIQMFPQENFTGAVGPLNSDVLIYGPNTIVIPNNWSLKKSVGHFYLWLSMQKSYIKHEYTIRTEILSSTVRLFPELCGSTLCEKVTFWQKDRCSRPACSAIVLEESILVSQCLFLRLAWRPGFVGVSSIWEKRISRVGETFWEGNPKCWFKYNQV